MHTHIHTQTVSFFFQAEDGIRDFCLSRGLGDVYKRQVWMCVCICFGFSEEKNVLVLV